ncbi:MAG: hypothetical protein FJY82_02615 [Candidatus Aminicenantes bacterium]|nr:hypothetical protein [Candidatus Aminicenantes bacterium]
MRKTLFILSVLSTFILMASFVEAMDKSEVDSKIKKIESYLEKPGGPGSNGKIMFSLLLESILQAAPETGCRQLFQNGPGYSKEEPKVDKIDACVKNLLDLAVMIVTPMRR